MKAIYLEPEMEIVRITAADVIVTSGCGGGTENTLGSEVLEELDTGF